MRLETTADGGAWASDGADLARFAPDGSRVGHRRDGHAAFAADGAGGLWLVEEESQARARRVDVAGKQLGVYKAANGRHVRQIVRGHAGGAWLVDDGAPGAELVALDGGGRPIARLVPEIGCVAIAAAPAGGVVVLGASGQLARFAADATPQGVGRVGATAALLAADARGGGWVADGHGRLWRFSPDLADLGHVALPGEVAAPLAIAMGSGGHVWALHGGGRRLTRVGDDLRVVWSGELRLPWRELAIDPDGRAWLLAGTSLARVSPAGQLDAALPLVVGALAATADGGAWLADPGERMVFKLGAGGLDEAGATLKHAALALAAGPAGVWATHVGGASRIGPDGAVATTAPVGAKDATPLAVAADDQGGAWVADTRGGRLVALSSAGARRLEVDLEGRPVALALAADGTLWACDAADGSVARVAPDGAIRGRTPVGVGPCDLALDGAGHAWVACFGDGRVVRVAPDGAIAEAIAVGGEPVAVAVDATGQVWIADWREGRLIGLGPDGAPRGELAARASRLGAAGDALWLAHGPGSYAPVASRLAPVGLAPGAYAPVVRCRDLAVEGGALYRLGPAGGPTAAVVVGHHAGRVAAGPGGEVWVVHGPHVSRVDPDGTRHGPFDVGTTPDDLAVGPDGHVWLAFTNAGAVGELTPRGEQLRSAPVPYPACLTFDAQGRLWVASHARELHRLAPDGAVALTVPLPGPAGGGRQFWGLAGAPDGTLWLADGVNHEVVRLDAMGAELGRTPLPDARAIAFGPTGEAYVGPLFGTAVTRLAPDGAVLGTFPVGRDTTGLAVDAGGTVWVSGGDAGKVARFAPDGKKRGATPLGRCLMGVVATRDAVWVSDAEAAGARVRHLRPQLPLVAWPVDGEPEALAIDRAGHLWVAGRRHHVVRCLAADGRPLAERDLGHRPLAIAAHPLGGVWILRAAPAGAALVRLAADATMAAELALPATCRRLLVDATGAAWALGHGAQVWRASPDGATLDAVVPSAGSVLDGVVDAAGAVRVVVQDQGKRQLVRLAPDGSTAEPIALDRVARGLAVAPDGGVWLADGGRLVALAADGQRRGEWPVETGTEGLAIDPLGRPWVLGRQVVVRFSADGRPEATYFVGAPRAIAFEPSGRAWVVDGAGDRVVAPEPDQASPA